MFFPSEEEQRYVLRKLVPQARKQGVFDELRGWSWHQPPAAPVYEQVRLGVSEVANKYCPTGRDVFLRRVMKTVMPANGLMLEGQALHRTLAEIITAAKRTIYVEGRSCLDQLDQLRGLPLPWLDDMRLTEEDRLRTVTKANLLREHEARVIVQRVQDVLSRQPYAGADAIAALALPVVVEQRLDGRFLGLSPHLAVDALSLTQMILAEVKFGAKEEFHRLATAGYAMVMESLYEWPVDLGCLIYVDVRNDRVEVERDFHIIDDELRQAFLNERDEKARMVEEAEDPGLPPACYQYCPYLPVCVPQAGAGRQTPRLRRLPAKGPAA